MKPLKDYFGPFFNKQYSVPKTAELGEAKRAFSTLELLTFWVLGAALAISTIILLVMVSNSFLVQVPARGGTLTEGIVGTPRFINPLFAVSQADKDVSALVYSGLMKPDNNGGLVPDLAQSYTVSPDGKTYTFTIRGDAYFQDGQPVTADDVVFTVDEAQDPTLQSPREANWEGVTVQKINDKEVSFTLRQPYAPFLENMTMGILPKHIWGTITDDQFTFSNYNTNPIGSGAYEVTNISKDGTGIPTSYTLAPFSKYVGGEALISTLVLNFYSDEPSALNAYRSGNIDSLASLSPEDLTGLNTSRSNIESSPLPRIFGVFFNQNQNPVFTNKEVRVALNEVVDRNALIQSVLGGYGVPITNPIPFGLLNAATSTATSTASSLPTAGSTASSTTPLAQAQALLAKNGWKPNASGILAKTVKVGSKSTTYLLSFTLSTANSPELVATANMLKAEWQQLGAQVTIQSFELGDLNSTVIRPRKYDALLFGEVVGRDLDLYAFWDSSQRNDPGLNIAMYTNAKADKALEALRTTSDPVQQLSLLEAFNAQLQMDVPAVFLYSPDFIYLLPKTLNNFTMKDIDDVSERFTYINMWYLETQKLWKIFVKS